MLVGETAKRQAVTNVDRTIASVKRHMGTDWTTGDRRQEVHAAGDLGAHPAEAEARRRAVPRRHRHRRGRHRPGVLQRRRAPGHQGGRRDRGPQRAAHHQRAHRGRPRLRPRQGQGGRAHPRLRPRWRHVRRLPPRGGQGRRLLDHPGARDRRRQPPRRRRLGPAHRRVADQALQGLDGRRRLEGQDRPAAPQGGRRAGEEGALELHDRRASSCPTSRSPRTARPTSTRRSPAPSSRT